jgi:dihydrofolate reductase
MANIVYIATSLDGYIARKDGGIDWLDTVPNPSQSDYGFYELIARIDAHVIGRKTYEVVLGFGSWPYTKPVFVLSRTLGPGAGGAAGAGSGADDVLGQVLTGRASGGALAGGGSGMLAGGAELLSVSPREAVANLNARGLRNLYIDGGVTIQSFLREDLIDEMIITRIPILLGEGIPLFGPGGELAFRHEETVVYDNALVKSRYVRVR